MTFFWILWSFSALMSLVPIYFFFVGLADGSITSKNMGLWALILLIVAAVLLGSLWLKGDHLGLSKIILLLAAIPGLFVLLYFLIVITSKARWN
jgi:hypothetical protein